MHGTVNSVWFQTICMEAAVLVGEEVTFVEFGFGNMGKRQRDVVGNRPPTGLRPYHITLTIPSDHSPLNNS